jgi:hypothetical protein
MEPQGLIEELRAAMPKASRSSALGTIDAGYVSGRPRVVFDGESAASTRAYPYASSYAPAAGDRVLLVRSGHTWVVLCKVL